MEEKFGKTKTALTVFGVILFLAFLAYVGWGYWSLKQVNRSYRESWYAARSLLDASLQNLAEMKRGNLNLAEALQNERNKVALFDNQLRSLIGQVGDLTGTVGVLDKLSKTDPELLKKYSKVYFLNENYVPVQLALIDEQYIYDKDKPQQIHKQVWPFLEGLLEAAQQNQQDLKVLSGYRSFNTQAKVKSGYKFVYGSGANQFSADQGYSEHQLGTTVDFTTSEIEESLVDFEGTDGYRWLRENAHKYGFIMSYPENNGYYEFEPWHWRFVGRELATKLYNSNQHFYDLSQREIDGYLVKLFD